MALWTDDITPVELTGFARAALDDYENPANGQSLQSFLPNETLNDIVAKVEETEHGLVEVANFRSYDAELDFGESLGGSRRWIELPALGRKMAVSEYDQIRMRGASSDTERLNAIQQRTVDAVHAVADRMEQMRGIVIDTGKATINQSNFKTEDDFSRDSKLSVASKTKWDTTGAKALEDLLGFMQTYEDTNNATPGVMLVSRKVKRALLNLPEFQTRLADGSTRPGRVDEILAVLDSYGLPPLVEYNRKVKSGGQTVNVLPDTKAYFLPAQGASQLGRTYWGRTLTSTDAGWGIADQDRPGIVTGVYRNEQPPMITEVVADAIGLPILANANLVMDMTVLGK